jgi:CheY-like chemotaxis protein
MNFEILLVDDDPIVQYLHKGILSRCNYPTPKLFFDGGSALEHILMNRDMEVTYLVLLDINMPIMDGWTFLRELENHTILSEVKVAIITSSIDRLDKEKAKESNKVFQFIEKPLRVETMNMVKKEPYFIRFFDGDQ